MSYSAGLYEDLMVPGLFGPWASHVIESANPQPGERVLDVACGTGIVARSIAPRVGSQGSVIGLDLSQDMIDVARAAAETEGLAIEWHAGPAERLPFPDDSFDLVLCQFGLMFFADRLAALSEMHRVLKSDGRVVLSVWQSLDRHPFSQTLHDASSRRLGKSSVGAVFSLGDPDELRRLLTEAGFQDVEIEPLSITARSSNPPEFLAWEIDVDPAETPALQDLDGESRQAILATLHEEMQTALREVMQGGEVVMPSHALIARARRDADVWSPR
ncbi:MAG TPA: class I SAM-dependent methyltransferase [Microbacterium sp.]|nr:class I SAM-dependent methyltransferase [Microbacterium sp.]